MTVDSMIAALSRKYAPAFAKYNPARNEGEDLHFWFTTEHGTPLTRQLSTAEAEYMLEHYVPLDDLNEERYPADWPK